MTRIDIQAELYINGCKYLIRTYGYMYENVFKSYHLSYTFNKLKKSKFEYKGWQYNREMDIYVIYFELDVII